MFAGDRAPVRGTTALEFPQQALTLSRSNRRKKALPEGEFSAEIVDLIADGRGRPLNLILTPGNINDTTMLAHVLDGVRVARSGPGRPRTRPDIVQADKGYPSRANRAYLAARGIKANIPDRADQIAPVRRRTRCGPSWSPACR